MYTDNVYSENEAQAFISFGGIDELVNMAHMGQNEHHFYRKQTNPHKRPRLSCAEDMDTELEPTSRQSERINELALSTLELLSRNVEHKVSLTNQPRCVPLLLSLASVGTVCAINTLSNLCLEGMPYYFTNLTVRIST